jgi:hypothetical protein
VAAHSTRAITGIAGCCVRYPRKPPRMPQAKYDQLLDKLAAAECIVENAANGRLFAGLARIESLTVDQLFDKLATAKIEREGLTDGSKDTLATWSAGADALMR